jgi:hypothetical protein
MCIRICYEINDKENIMEFGVKEQGNINTNNNKKSDARMCTGL